MASILYVGPLEGTASQRAQTLEDLGHRLVRVAGGIPVDRRYQLYRLFRRVGGPRDLHGTNRSIRSSVRPGAFEILWIDKGLDVRRRTLERVREVAPDTMLVHYSPDDYRLLFEESDRFADTIPLYDLVVTTKSYNVPELREQGARDVLFVDNAFSPDVHKPVPLSEDDRRRYGCDVGFVGFYERERADSMYRVAESGIRVTVRGPGWNRYPRRHENMIVEDRFLDADEYVRVINATKINLAFLRKQARDLQTTRSVEIPACGAFMLAERTSEHLGLFREGEEAEFFDGDEELIEKCRRYLADDPQRERVAAAGLERCRRDRYDNAGRLQRVLDRLGGAGVDALCTGSELGPGEG